VDAWRSSRPNAVPWRKCSAQRLSGQGTGDVTRTLWGPGKSDVLVKRRSPKATPPEEFVTRYRRALWAGAVVRSGVSIVLEFLERAVVLLWQAPIQLFGQNAISPSGQTLFPCLRRASEFRERLRLRPRLDAIVDMYQVPSQRDFDFILRVSMNSRFG
jgi:hypothetical protein